MASLLAVCLCNSALTAPADAGQGDQAAKRSQSAAPSPAAVPEQATQETAHQQAAPSTAEAQGGGSLGTDAQQEDHQDGSSMSAPNDDWGDFVT